jgi:adenylylsulfate kinase-like enzyme
MLRREIDNFMGISDHYDVPENPQITIEIETDKESTEESAEKIVKYLEKNKLI